MVSMRNGKSPGHGGVPFKLIENRPEKVFEGLAYTFNIFLRCKEIPPNWRRAYISNEYKIKEKSALICSVSRIRSADYMNRL